MVFLQIYEDLCTRNGQSKNPIIKSISSQIQHERTFKLLEPHRINTIEEWGHILSALKQDSSIEKISIINPRYKLQSNKGVKVLPLIASSKDLTINILKWSCDGNFGDIKRIFGNSPE